MVLDLRASHEHSRDMFLEQLQSASAHVSQRESCAIEIERVSAARVAYMDDSLRERLTRSADHLGLSHINLSSGAGHDMAHMHREYRDLFQSLRIPLSKAVPTYLWDARYSLVTSVLAGFGRAISEVGAVIIVGGNIDHLTRVMTTAIALETSKGELAIALALGIILLTLALIVNAAVTTVRTLGLRNAYV